MGDAENVVRAQKWMDLCGLDTKAGVVEKAEKG